MRSPKTNRIRRPMSLEALEDRRMMAAFVVSNLSDGPVAAAGDLPGSLRQAIFDANQATTDDVIVFTTLPGTIDLTSGPLRITDELTVNGPGQENLTIDANGQSGVFVVNDNLNPSIEVVLDGLTLTGGVADSGGAIQADETLTVSNMTIVGNRANGDGGGIFSTAHLEVQDSTITGNRAFGSMADGGGIFNLSTMRVTDSTISNNTAGEQGGGIHAKTALIERSTINDNNSVDRGGGVYAFGGIYLTISESTFSGNRTTGDRGVGGGVSLRSVASPIIQGSEFRYNQVTGEGTNGGGLYASGDVTITDSVFANNRADHGNGAALYSHASIELSDTSILNNVANHPTRLKGGGVYAVSDISATRVTVQGNLAISAARAYGGGMFAAGDMTLVASTVAGNAASGGITRGGGVYANRALTVQDSTISHNQAQSGGGIRGLGTVTIMDSTISSNIAEYGGGMGVDGPITIVRSTIVNNESISGGGVGNFGASPMSIRNSVISGNMGFVPDVMSYAATIASVSYSLIEETSGLTLSGVGNITGQSAQLGPLTDNGGTVKTHAPLPGSPVIDAADPAAVAGVGGTPGFDQRGAPFSRVTSDGNSSTARMDMGAIELQSTIGCDLNGDGACDVADIDAMVAAIVGQSSDPSFDLTGDGLINLADRDEWLALAGATNLPSGNAYLLGDANLDGAVDGSDFILWNQNKFTNVAAWSAGDFNADGAVDGSDFILWNQNKFQAADLALRDFDEPVSWHSCPSEFAC